MTTLRCKILANLCHHRLRLSSVSNVLKYQNDINTSPMAFLCSFHPNLLSRRYCVKSCETLQVVDSSTVLAEEFEVDESVDSSSTFDSKPVYRSFQDRCVNKISKALKCSKKESLTLYKKFPVLFHESIDETIHKISALIDRGICPVDIVKNVVILEFSNDELSFKIGKMDLWGLSKQEKSQLVGILKLDNDTFTKLCTIHKVEKNQIPEKSRLLYFSKFFNISLDQIVDFLMRHNYILTKDFQEFTKINQLLFENGVTLQLLSKNLWIYQHTYKFIEKWINLAQVEPKESETTMINEKFASFFRKIAQQNDVQTSILTTNQTAEEYLAEKLQVDVDLVEYLREKHKKTFDRHLSLLTETIDFLLSKGYNGNDICSCIKTILKRDTKFLQMRLDECKKYNCENPPLRIIASSERIFQKYVKSWESSNSHG